MSSFAKKVKVTILCDNHTVSPELLAEHGLSLFVETDGGELLFDTGASGVFVGNAARLGVGISREAVVVLSHGHYDHTGGLSTLLSAYGGREIIGHPEVFSAKFSHQRSQPLRAIGCPYSKSRLVQLGAILRLNAEPREIAPGVMTTGLIPRVTDFEHIPPHFKVKRKGKIVRDMFDDEQALIVRLRNGLVVIVGCSHRGLINMLRGAIALTGDERVLAVIGGTHLAPAEKSQVARTIEELKALGVGQLVACHCTGFGASVELSLAFGKNYSPGGVGTSFILQ